MYPTLSVLLLALCLSTESLKAEDGYEVFPAYPWSRYKMPPTKLNWTDAVAACEDDGKGSHLVVINSEQEAEVIKELVARLDPSNFQWPWAGINDIDIEGQWVTVQGGLLSETGYDGWGDGYPVGGRAWNCGFLRPDARYYDYPCSQVWFFLCERPNV